MGVSMTKLSRRLRFGTSTLVVLAATTVSCVMLNLIAERLSVRIDVTSMGEHRLSERTRSLVRSLDAPYEIVVAADWATKDRRVADRVQDTIRRFGDASDRIDATLIDTGSTRGAEEYVALLHRLADREADRLKTQHETLAAGAKELEKLVTLFTGLEGSLSRIAEQLPGADEATATTRTYFQQQSTLARSAASQVSGFAATTQEHLNARVGQIGLPRLEEAKALTTRVFEDLDSIHGGLLTNLRTFADASSMPEEPRNLARQLERSVRIARDDAAIAADRIGRLKTLDLVRISRAMETGEVAIVIGPDGVIGVDTGALLPPGQWLDQQRGIEADIGRRAEELLTSSIGVLRSPERPLVVVIHSQQQRFLDAPDIHVIDRVRERLGMFAIDFVEWLAVTEPEMPDLSELDPLGTRPVVYVVIGTDTTKTDRSGVNGPQRAEALANAMRLVVEDGGALLVSLVPSTLPGYGVDDPMLRPLAPFGVNAETGRPIIQRQLGSGAAQIVTQRRLEAVESDHAFFGALRGLPTVLNWPIGLKLEEPSSGGSVDQTVLMQITDGDSWGESQWLPLWQTDPSRRAAMPNPPQRDEGRDWTEGPWPVCASAERRVPGSALAQRLVVVGSFDWFFDEWTRPATIVDERIVADNPGNAELFEAAVLWLAGQDELIARSPTARATPRIESIDPGRLSALRWSLVGGLPGLVLLLGVLWWLLSR